MWAEAARIFYEFLTVIVESHYMCRVCSALTTHEPELPGLTADGFNLHSCRMPLGGKVVEICHRKIVPTQRIYFCGRKTAPLLRIERFPD